MWIKCADRLPEKAGLYLVFAASADSASPLIMTAWFNADRPPETRWGLVPIWSKAISHWLPLPNPPEAH